jgi:hypothetical protein
MGSIWQIPRPTEAIRSNHRMAGFGCTDLHQTERWLGMSTTPDPTRNIGDSCCSKCGKLLLVNDGAIVHTNMRNDVPLVLGNCCADLVIGALIQDLAKCVSHELTAGYWIDTRNTGRLKRVANASKQVTHYYELSLDYEVNYVRWGKEK